MLTVETGARLDIPPTWDLSCETGGGPNTPLLGSEYGPAVLAEAARGPDPTAAGG